MSFASRLSRDLARGVSIAVVLGLLAAFFLWWVVVDGNQRRYSAVFTGVVGLYEDNDVRILGVKVGHVDKVTPEGDTVLTMVSDDNFSMIQRTLLLQFTLVE